MASAAPMAEVQEPSKRCGHTRSEKHRAPTRPPKKRASEIARHALKGQGLVGHQGTGRQGNHVKACRMKQVRGHKHSTTRPGRAQDQLSDLDVLKNHVKRRSVSMSALPQSDELSEGGAERSRIRLSGNRPRQATRATTPQNGMHMLATTQATQGRDVEMHGQEGSAFPPGGAESAHVEANVLHGDEAAKSNELREPDQPAASRLFEGGSDAPRARQHENVQTEKSHQVSISAFAPVNLAQRGQTVRMCLGTHSRAARGGERTARWTTMDILVIARANAIKQTGTDTCVE